MNDVSFLTFQKEKIMFDSFCAIKKKKKDEILCFKDRGAEV